MKRRLSYAAGTVAIVASSRQAAAKGCHEVSDVVGYERCHRFGDDWATDARPPVELGLELPYVTFDPNGTTFSTGGKHDPGYDGQSLGVKRVDTFGFALRATGFILGPVYFGGIFGVGFGRDDYAPVSENGVVLTRSESAVNTTLFYVGSLLGIRLPLGRISLRLEALVGGSFLDIDQRSAVGDYMSQAPHFMVEPRGLLDVWLTPHVTIGAMTGVNAMDPEDRMLGLTLAYHVRCFDGSFAVW